MTRLMNLFEIALLCLFVMMTATDARAQSTSRGTDTNAVAKSDWVLSPLVMRQQLLSAADTVNRSATVFVVNNVPFGSALVNAAGAQASSPVTVPSAYNKIVASGKGVTVYQKGSENTFVTVADLRTANLVSLIGSYTAATDGSGNGLVGRKSISQFWDDTQQNPLKNQIIAVTNGTFFFDQEDPSSHISFGLTVGGRVLSYDADANNVATKGYKRTLVFDNTTDSAAVFTAFDRQTFTRYPNVVGGLSVDCPAFNYRTQRTVVGLVDQDGNGSRETVLIFCSGTKNYTPQEAANVLATFRATAFINLDGGGSSALRIKQAGSPMTKFSGRTVPHALAVFAGQ